jgi:hypothetical protein
LSFLSEQGEHEEGYLIGIQHTIQNLVASVIQDILQTEGRDIDSVAEYIKFNEYVLAFDSPFTVERDEMIREKIKTDIVKFMSFIEENIFGEV